MLHHFPWWLQHSSVTRGGGGGAGRGSSLPHWLVKYAKSHVFGAFEADFLWKIENRSPHRKTAPPQRFEFLNLAKKSVSISVKTFFLETTWFWAKKTFEFLSFPRKFVSIFGQTVWNLFKNNENSDQGRLHFSHFFKIAPPPTPFPNPGYAPAPAPCNIDEARKAAARFDTPMRSQASARTEMSERGRFCFLFGVAGTWYSLLSLSLISLALGSSLSITALLVLLKVSLQR